MCCVCRDELSQASPLCTVAVNNSHFPFLSMSVFFPSSLHSKVLYILDLKQLGIGFSDLQEVPLVQFFSCFKTKNANKKLQSVHTVK